MTSALVELHGISKSYPGVVALEPVDFCLAPGEVRALLGKNGAGKSTLVKILAGVVKSDSGEIKIAGEVKSFQSPADGIKAGIATVHQELSVVPDMSVAENIYLGSWPRRNGRIDWGEMYKGAAKVLLRLGVTIDPKLSIRKISIAERQLVEIGRALRQGARILILDEPTSSLVAHEVEVLLAVIRSLSASGTGIIYISHRMEEIRKIASSVTIMRDGRHIATGSVEEFSSHQVVEMLLGTKDQRDNQRRPAQPQIAPVIFSVKNLSVAPRVIGASFEIREGEVLGIAGVLGSGRTEILQALAGLRPFKADTAELHGRNYRPNTLAQAMTCGVIMTPEDRRTEGAITMLGIDENLVMSNWPSVSRFGVIRRAEMIKKVAESIRSLGIKLARPGEALANLSGGNQQKVVIGKALNANPKILLLDEPTRGVDIGAKRQIYQLMRQFADRGFAAVFVSSELEEFNDVCDRVIVLRSGRITAELSGENINTQRLVDLTMGEQKEDRSR
jgi:sugar transport system ATP-binding protein